MTWVAAGLTSWCVVLACRPRVASRPIGTTRRADPLGPRLVHRVRSALDRRWPGRVATRRDGQLPDLLDRLAAALRAGRSLGPALVELAPATAPPLRDDLLPLAAALEQGRPLAAVLQSWVERGGATPDLQLTTAALRLGAGAGGAVALAVDRTAATLRERRALEREVHSLATQARASAAVLVLAPIGFTALVGSVEPSTVLFLLTTPTGLACVVAGLALDALGAAWMTRIVRRAA